MFEAGQKVMMKYEQNRPEGPLLPGRIGVLNSQSRVDPRLWYIWLYPIEGVGAMDICAFEHEFERICDEVQV